MTVSIDQRAYEGYVRFCRSVDVTPMPFEIWYAHTNEVNVGDLAAHHQFHGHYNDKHGVYGKLASDQSDGLPELGYQTYGCGGGRRVLPHKQHK